MQEVSALLQAARHASSQGQHDKAARVLTAFLEKAPQIPLGWFTLAGIYAKQVHAACCHIHRRHHIHVLH